MIYQGNIRIKRDLGERGELTVTPLCPPMTGTTIELDSDKSPMTSDTNVEARTTSRVVTPKSLGGTHVTNVRKKGI